MDAEPRRRRPAAEGSRSSRARRGPASLSFGRTDRRALLGLVLLVLAVGGLNQWWSARSQAALGAEVAALAAPGDLRMLASTTCPYCALARQWLREHQVPFDECFIERDAACAAQYEALRAPGTPVVLVRGQPQLGFDAARVRDALRRAPPRR